VKGIESTVERDVEIGNVELRFFRGRTELRDVVVHDLPEFGEEPFVKAPSVSARFHSGRYVGSLGTRLRAEVTLERPVVLLERNERGDWNVGDLVRRMARKLLAARKDLSWDCPYSGLELHIRARDVTLRIRDDLAGQSTEITGISFDADLPRLGSPLTYRLAMEVPVGGQPGKVELTGSVALFRDGKLTVSSVKGEALRLKVVGLDLRALPGIRRPSPGLGLASVASAKEVGGRAPGAEATDEAVAARVSGSAGRATSTAGTRVPEFPHGAAVDLDITVSADSLGAVRSRVDGCLRGPHSRRASAPELLSFDADLSGALVPPRIERGEAVLRGPGWKLDCQGRLIPALPESREQGEAVGGAELLDLDAVFEADLKRLGGLLGFLPGAVGRGDRPPVPLDGRFFVKLSTSGPTRELAVSVKMGAEGLVCPRTGAPPEDVSIGLEGSLRLAGWSGLDGASIKACTAEASFIHASVAPGEVSLLTTPKLASALLGPLEFDLDLEELGRRYGPLLPFPVPPWRLHGWAELEGSGGRLRARSAVVSRSGGTAEGAATVELAAKDGPRVELDWRARGPEGSHARIRGGVTFGEEEPSFEATASASGDLSRVLETARPYLRPAESLWARGRFNLDDVRASGTPSRFSTTGRLELLEFELWGGSPTTPPFSESRFESNWNLDFDLSRGPARMQANLLKGSSSTLQFKLSGDVSDLGRGLGRYDLQAFADFDRLGAMLKKLALVPASAALRGTMNVELKADTKRGDIDLGRLELDTPFIEARGGGKIRQVPLASLLALVYPGKNEGGKAAGEEAQASPAADGRNGSRAVSRAAEVAVAKLPEEVSGKLHVAAKLNVDEIAGLVRSLPSGRPDPGAGSGPEAEATGEIGLDVTAEGSGGELIVTGRIDLDGFAGRLGRHVRKSTEELASLGFSASVATGRPALVILRSGVLTLGGAERPATFDLEGSLAQGLDRFELACSSERFEIEPVAPLLKDLAPGCTGVASVDIRSRGELARGALVPGTLALDGEIGLRGAELRLRRYPELRAKADGLVRLAGRSLSGDGLTVALMLEAGAADRARVRPPRDRRRPAGRAGATRKVGVLKLVKLGLRPRRDPPGMSLSFDARADELDLGTLVS
ncbi:MAG: AsmA family protein, partial [Planctomycetota bacterium]